MNIFRNSLFVFLAFFLTVHAEESWTRKHFISLGAGATVTHGDLEGETSIRAKDTETEETIFLPNLGSFLLPELTIGANLNQHTIALDFSYATPATNFAKGTLLVDETETSILRVGLGYRYNFFWPERFQVFAGLNYTFMHLSTEDNAFFKDEDENEKRSSATLMGNGFSLNLGVTYFIHPSISMDLHGRFRTMIFSSISSDENGTCEIDDPFVQFMEEVVLNVSYHF